MGKRKRAPNKSLQTWRSGFLLAAQSFSPRPPADPVPGLSPGNRKTGKRGSVYRTVFVWNLPPVATCPGRSEWCMRYCYNADDRTDVFPIATWCENWYTASYKPDVLRTVILRQLASAKPPVGVRVHSSGDFYDEQYVQFWASVAARSQTTAFWAYTRSWAVRSLRSTITRLLRPLPNFQVLASWDGSMPSPPRGWRTSVVVSTLAAARHLVNGDAGLRVCCQCSGAAPNCASCGFCGTHSGEGVVLVAH